MTRRCRIGKLRFMLACDERNRIRPAVTLPAVHFLLRPIVPEKR